MTLINRHTSVVSDLKTPSKHKFKGYEMMHFNKTRGKIPFLKPKRLRTTFI